LALACRLLWFAVFALIRGDLAWLSSDLAWRMLGFAVLAILAGFWCLAGVPIGGGVSLVYYFPDINYQLITNN